MTTCLGWCFKCQTERRWASSLPEHWRLGSDHEVCAGPVWPGVRVHDQAEADRLIPELLRIEAPGHWVEWVPGRGVPNFVPYIGERTFECGCDPGFHETELELAFLGGETYCCTACGERCKIGPAIRWLRIAIDLAAPEVAAVLEVVDQCREVGVPFWMPRGGSLWPFRGLPEVAL